MISLKLDAGVVVEDEKDVIASGFGAWDTGIYKVTLKAAYIDVTKSGAVMANAILIGEDGREHIESECIMSKKSGTLKATYIDKKTHKPMPLPGYAKFLTLFRTIGGNPKLLDLDMDMGEVVLELYDFDANGKTKQKKHAFADFINVPMQIAIQKVIEDKRKNVAPEGEPKKYEPTGETRELNEVKKWFNEDGLTLQELKDEVTEPKFQGEWLEAYPSDNVRDKSTKKAAAAGTAGAPAVAPTQELDLS